MSPLVFFILFSAAFGLNDLTHSRAPPGAWGGYDREHPSLTTPDEVNYFVTASFRREVVRFRNTKYFVPS